MARRASNEMAEIVGDFAAISLQEEASQLELFVTTPGLNHVLEKILGHLDIVDLVACTKLNDNWSQYLEARRTVWIRAIDRKMADLRFGFPTIMKPSEVVAEFDAIFPKRKILATSKKRDILTMMREGVRGHYENSTTLHLRAQTLQAIGRLDSLKNPQLGYGVFLCVLRSMIEELKVLPTCEERAKNSWSRRPCRAMGCQKCSALAIGC